MPIDISTEKLVPIAEVPDLLGLDITPRAVRRWASPGLAGRRLETVRVGRQMCTSVAALQRFLDHPGTLARIPSSNPAPCLGPAGKQETRRHYRQRVSKVLARHGINLTPP